MGKVKLKEFENKQGIYIIHNKKNNLSYIGKTSNLMKRLIEHFSMLAPITSNLLYFELKTLDWSMFEVEVFLYPHLSEEELSKKELEFINKRKTIYPHGYNLYGNENSEHKIWYLLNMADYSIEKTIDPTGKNLFYENLKLNKQVLVPGYIIDFIQRGFYSKYVDVDFLYEYYMLNNVIALPKENDSNIETLKSVSLKNIIKKNPDLAIGIEKTIYNNQVRVDNTTYIKLPNNFKFKNAQIYNLDERLKELLQYYNATNCPLVRDLYVKTIFEEIYNLYGEQTSPGRFAKGTFKYNDHYITLITYPYLGYFVDNTISMLTKYQRKYSMNIYSVNEKIIVIESTKALDEIIISEGISHDGFTVIMYKNILNKGIKSHLEEIIKYNNVNFKVEIKQTIK